MSTFLLQYLYSFVYVTSRLQIDINLYLNLSICLILCLSPNFSQTPITISYVNTACKCTCRHLVHIRSWRVYSIEQRWTASISWCSITPLSYSCWHDGQNQTELNHKQTMYYTPPSFWMKQNNKPTAGILSCRDMLVSTQIQVSARVAERTYHLETQPNAMYVK